MIFSHPLLFGVEPNSLAYDSLGLAVLAPYGKRKLESDSKDALVDLLGTVTQRMGVRVELRRVVGVGRVVPAHVEALHRDNMLVHRCTKTGGVVAEDKNEG